LSVICIAETYATYLFAEFGVVEVQTAELWQMNSVTVKLVLYTSVWVVNQAIFWT